MNRTMLFGVIIAALWLTRKTPAKEKDNEKSPLPYLKQTFIVSGHRAGGRVHAPDNSMPNILFAIENKLTAIEVDLRLTRDGKLILWHDYSFPKTYVGLGGTGRVSTKSLSAAEISKIRYSAKVGGKTWNAVGIVFADDLVKVAKGKINLQLDVKDVPADNILAFIRRHEIQKECMVMSTKIDLLQKIQHAEPDVCLEFADNTLGRHKVDGNWVWYPLAKQHQLYHALMKQLAAVRIDAFCTKGLTKEKVEICHQYGIIVRTSAGHLRPGVDPERYLKLGVDYALTDDPLLMSERVKKLRPGVALSKPGQTFFDLIRGKKDR